MKHFTTFAVIAISLLSQPAANRLRMAPHKIPLRKIRSLRLTANKMRLPPQSMNHNQNHRLPKIQRIVLPTIDDAHPIEKRMELLENVEKQLSGDIVSNCKYEDFTDVFVAMPKFKLAPATSSIKKMLQSMGMHKAFSEQAEFYAMPNTTPKPSDPSNYLMIDDVLHKAFIEIDEKGGEAAAAMAEATLSAYEEKEPVVPKFYHFTVDHPFIYMIIEQSTGAAIFMGRVTDL